MRMQQMIWRVQRQFGDENEAQIFVNDIVDWLNEGQLELARQTEILQNKIEITIDGNLPQQALPRDFILEKRVEFNKKRLLQTTLLDLNTVAGTESVLKDSEGDPVYYYIWSNQLYLYPWSYSLDQKVINVWYVRCPTPLVTSSETSELPETMHQDLVRFALMRAKELNEDDDVVTKMGADLSARMANSKYEAQFPHNETYPTVRDDPGDYW